MAASVCVSEAPSGSEISNLTTSKFCCLVLGAEFYQTLGRVNKKEEAPACPPRQEGRSLSGSVAFTKHDSEQSLCLGVAVQTGAKARTKEHHSK